MKLFVGLLAFYLSGCAVVWIVEKIEAIHPRATTQPWHFEGERVVYER